MLTPETDRDESDLVRSGWRRRGKVSRMPTSYAVERKVGVYALTAEERQQEEDVRWALHDPEVLANYVGEFVVPVDRRIVAHGQDIESVLEEAARLTDRVPERLPVCGIDDPLLDLPH